MASSGIVKKTDHPELGEALDPIVFLEFHTLKKLFMPEFLGLLKIKGYKAFLLEQPDYKAISECIDGCKNWIAQRSELANGLSVLLKLAVGESERKAILSLLSENPRDLKPDEDPNIFSDDRWIKRIMALPTDERSAAGHYFSIAAGVRYGLVNLTIFEKIESLNFEYHAIDIKVPDGEIYGDGTEFKYQTERNANMADQFNVLSKKYNGGVIGLMGAFHFPVQNILAERGWTYGARSHWFLINPGRTTIFEPVSSDKFEFPEDQQRLLSKCTYGLDIIDSLADVESYLKILGNELKKEESKRLSSSLGSSESPSDLPRRPDIFEEARERRLDLNEGKSEEEIEIEPVSKSAERFDAWMKKYTGHNGTHNEELVDWLSADSGAKHVQDYRQFCELATALKAKGYSTVPPPSESEFKEGISKYNKKAEPGFRY